MLVETYQHKRILASRHIKAILHLPAVDRATATTLNVRHDTVRQHLSTLKSIHVIPDDMMVIEIVAEKLPTVTRREWKRTLKWDALPSLEQFFKFLRETSVLLRSFEQNAPSKLTASRKRNIDKSSTPAKFQRSESGSRTFATGLTPSCSKWKLNHLPHFCPEFKQLNIATKRITRSCTLTRDQLTLHPNHQEIRRTLRLRTKRPINNYD